MRPPAPCNPPPACRSHPDAPDHVPRTLLVSRHAGAVAWLRDALQAPHAEVVAHLDDTEALQPGDQVAGTVPLHLAAALCTRGVIVLGLDLPVSLAQRGQALGAEEMRRAGARLTRYRVHAEPWHPGKPVADSTAGHERLDHGPEPSNREK